MQTTVLKVTIIGPKKMTSDELMDAIRLALGDNGEVLVEEVKEEESRVSEN